MQELPGPASDLPNTLIRTPPIFLQPLQYTLKILPFGMRNRLTVFIREIDRVHHLAINVQLQLFVSGIADPHGPGILITAKLVKRDLFQILPAVYAVHDLQRTSLRIVAQTVL